MGLRAAWQWMMLGRKLERVKDEAEKESAMNGYDVQTTIRKGAAALGHGLLGVLGAAALSYLADPAAVSTALGQAGYKAGLVAVLVPLLTGLAKMGHDWLIHHNDPATVTPPRG